MHTHVDTEDLFIQSGSIEYLRYDGNGHAWLEAKAGDHVHVPSNARHAWRNVWDNPVVAFVITPSKLGCFFKEVGRPATGTPQPPTPEDLAYFAAVTERDARRECGGRDLESPHAVGVLLAAPLRLIDAVRVQFQTPPTID